MDLRLYEAAARQIVAEYVSSREVIEPMDRGPFDRDLWLRCSVCGNEFGDDRDFEAHQVEMDE